MRRSLSCILFFFLFLPLQAKEYKVLRSTVRVEPLRDGGLAVEEENLYLFTEGRFSYVFRTVPLQRRGGGRIEEILMDGLPLPAEGLPRGERKSVNRELRVKWVFSPTENLSRRFTLRYTLDDIVKIGNESGTYRFKPFPDDRGYLIESAQTLLLLPSSDPQTVAALQRGGWCEEGRGLWKKEWGAIPSQGDSPVLELSLPREFFSDLSPQRRNAGSFPEGESSLFLRGGEAFLVVLLVGGFFLFRLRAKLKRETPPSTPSLGFPDDTPPGLAGVLATLRGDVEPSSLWATLVDLAIRGVASVHCCKGALLSGGKEYLLRWNESPSLAPWEQEAIALLEGKRKGTEREVSLLSLFQTLAFGSKGYRKALEGSLEGAGLWSRERERQRKRVLLLSLLLLFLGLAAFVVGLIGADAWLGLPGARAVIAALLAGAGVGAMVLFLPYLLVGALSSSLTDQGYRRGLQWRATAKALKEELKGEGFNVERWGGERFPAYSIALNLTDAFQEAVKKGKITAAPPWFSTALADKAEVVQFGALIALMTASSTGAAAGVGGGGCSAAGGGSGGAG